MGKIVKYCAVCEESFSDRFSFCPNCAAALTAYEMNPVGAEPKSVEPVKVVEPIKEETVENFEPLTTSSVELPQTFETDLEPSAPAFLSNFEAKADDEILEIEDDEEEEPTLVTTPAFTVPAVASQSFEDYQQTYQTNSYAQNQPNEFVSEKRTANKKLDDDGFYSVTLVEPRNNGTRNLLLLGATILVLGIAIASVVRSIYNADAYIGALDEDLGNIVYVPNDEPTEVEPEKAPEKKKDDSGGGGGGNKDPNPVSKGREANMMKDPQVPPSVTIAQVTNPELKLNVGVKGPEKITKSSEPYGDPNSKYNVASDGPGEGGGQGTGRDRGQGPGTGPGIGPGSNGGRGGGDKGGTPGGDDDDDRNGGPPQMKTGPTVALSITSKPRANYTDAARQAQVQGTVTLRVTFNANGTIGSISAVSGLPNGLTEQAIAAARNIRFTPAMQNGVPKTVVKQVQYTFTLY